MKKYLFAVCMAAVFLLSGCEEKDSGGSVNAAVNAENPSGGADDATEDAADAPEKPSGEVIEITEKLFVEQTNNVYLNIDEYLGKTFKYEGIFLTQEYEGATYDFVIRYGPGCCGTDKNAGFEVSWDGARPKQNDWVQVVGTLEMYEEDGVEYPCINLTSLDVLAVRGKENVS
jgi:uncharacterized membrane protein YcgQ (UPF0703/DUF1980 family)